jgi:ABC-type multidrug transport system fused ATPase/permease subunit
MASCRYLCHNGGVTALRAVRTALGLLTPRDRRLYVVAVLIQMALSLLDLVGVLLLGAVGAIGVTAVQSQPPPAQIQSLAADLGLDGLSDQSLTAVLALTAGIFLLAKSIISSLLSRRTLKFLANRQALLAGRLTSSYLSLPLSEVQRRTPERAAFAIFQGTQAATLIILGSAMVALAEMALLVLLGTALLFVDPLVTIGAIAYFSVLAWALQRVMGRWAGNLGAGQAEADVASLSVLQEVLGSYREIVVMNRREYYVRRIQDWRWTSARINADRAFIAQFPKYAFEAALVVGALLLAAYLLGTQSAAVAVGTMVVFLAAGSRVMPSLLRLQTSTALIRDGAGVFEGTVQLAGELSSRGGPEFGSAANEPTGEPRGEVFVPEVHLTHVSVSYPGGHGHALSDINLRITRGEYVALVGPTGAGKSTLADVVLGVMSPTTGCVELSGRDPRLATSLWPGEIGYVPQEVRLVEGSIQENVALGVPADLVDSDQVLEVLHRAHLGHLVKRGAADLGNQIGSSGVRLSGGERQRIGIARALLSRPRLLVLDEATSNLDAETEHLLVETLQQLHGDVTLIVVAHRLATVRAADRVIYLDDGRVLADGSFETVRSNVPGFSRQAQLLGL